MNVQFKKGVLEMCVLAIISKKDCYGYELVEEISKHIEISEGTVYPLLRRLVNESYFTTYLKESTEGPPRKYYKITEQGNSYLNTQLAEWNEFVKAVQQFLEGEK